MNFGFTEEQELLRAEVRKFLDQNCPLDEVRKIVETGEGYSQSYFRRAAELGWVDIAENDLRIIISEQPENSAALNALGYTLADQTERYEEAEALIRQAFILEPDQPAIVDSMGWIAYRLNRLAESEEYLRRAWALDRNPEIAAHLGEVLWARGKPEAAMAIWNEGKAVDGLRACLPPGQ